jgi:hypothetical protein
MCVFVPVMNVHLVVSANYLQFEGIQQAQYLLQKK